MKAIIAVLDLSSRLNVTGRIWLDMYMEEEEDVAETIGLILSANTFSSGDNYQFKSEGTYIIPAEIWVRYSGTTCLSKLTPYAGCFTVFYISKCHI